VLAAVNRDLRKLPEALQDNALCVVAQTLAREIDAGDMASAPRLTRVLAELRKLAEPPKPRAGVPAVEEPVEEADVVDDLTAKRAARRSAASADQQRAASGEQRRRGGRRAR
jgi:hypothetical protein